MQKTFDAKTIYDKTLKYYAWSGDNPLSCQFRKTKIKNLFEISFENLNSYNLYVWHCT